MILEFSLCTRCCVWSNFIIPAFAMKPREVKHWILTLSPPLFCIASWFFQSTEGTGKGWTNLPSSAKTNLRDRRQGAPKAVAGTCWMEIKERSCKVSLGCPCRVGLSYLCRVGLGHFCQRYAGEYCVYGIAAWILASWVLSIPPNGLVPWGRTLLMVWRWWRPSSVQGLTVPCANRKSSIYQLGLGPRIRSFSRYSKYKRLEYRESEAFIIAEGWRDKGQEASIQMALRIHMGAASDCMSSSTSACNCLQSHLASVSPLPSKPSIHFLVDKH